MKKLTALLATALFALAGTALAQDKKAPAPAPAKKEAAAPAVEKKAPELMDVNTASEKDLATLDGIGEARAKAIVKNRPYKGKNEIVDKAGVPAAVYEKIKDKIIAHQKDEKKKPEPKKEEPKKEVKKDEKKK